MNIVFQIDGGIGKSIAATAVCKAIKTQYPEARLLVITGYPEVFLCNPNVDKVFNFNNLNYFYEDYIDGKEVKTFLHNPYQATDFITGEGHLIEVWCNMFGVRYNGELPELFITAREKAFYSRQFPQDKPIMLIQTNGGAAGQGNKYSWARDIPLVTAQNIVNQFAGQYQVLHLRREDQLPLQHTTPVQMEFRALATLIMMSEKRLLMDSFAQHAAAALGKPSVVCWIANTPQQFGYDIHTNIIANAPTIKPELRHSVFSRYNISGNATEFPYHSEREIFDDLAIFTALHTAPLANTQSTRVKNQIIADKIEQNVRRNGMVSRRLSFLQDKIDFSQVNTILDIGSWHLAQSVEFADIFSASNVHAFEPVPDSFQLCLNRHQGLPADIRQRISLHNIALSNAEGEIPFFVANPAQNKNIDMGFSSMFRFNDQLFDTNSSQNEIKVNANTLDAWCEQNNVVAVDIMWIDVQGAELLVFEGAKNILQNTKVILTEVGLKPYYEGHTLKHDVDNLLTGLGFTELKDAFELNGFDYEANAIYIRN